MSRAFMAARGSHEGSAMGAVWVARYEPTNLMKASSVGEARLNVMFCVDYYRRAVENARDGDVDCQWDGSPGTPFVLHERISSNVDEMKD